MDIRNFFDDGGAANPPKQKEAEKKGIQTQTMMAATTGVAALETAIEITHHAIDISRRTFRGGPTAFLRPARAVFAHPTGFPSSMPGLRAAGTIIMA